jgi:hypothetical protein
VVWCGWEEYDLGEGFASAGLEEPATRAFGRACRWYLPVFGAQDKAMTRLLEMARQQDLQGRQSDALRTYEGVRTAVWSTRWLFFTNVEALEEANAGIGRIRAAEPRPTDREPMERLLGRDETPNGWLSLLAVLLFLAWCVSTAACAWWCSIPVSPRLAPGDGSRMHVKPGFLFRARTAVRVLLSFTLSIGLAGAMMVALRFA